MQTKPVRDLWVLWKGCQILIFHTLSDVPYPHTARLEFPVDGPVQTPTLLRNTYFEDVHERQKQNKNA